MRKIDDSGDRSKSDCYSVLQQVGVEKEGRGKRVLTFYCLLQKRNIFYVKKNLKQRKLKSNVFCDFSDLFVMWLGI